MNKIKKTEKLKKIFLIVLMLTASCSYASDIVPVGKNNNTLYYKIGGGSEVSLPPVSEKNTITLNDKTNLGMGYSCSAFNPVLSVSNSINDLKDSADNLEKSVLENATASILLMPLYKFAQAFPTLYSLLNNNLFSAKEEVKFSTKKCQTVKNQIAQGQNPYKDWGTIAIGDQWKKKLTTESSDDVDINHVKKEIEAHSGEDGVTWVNGKKDSDGSFHAGGNDEPPIHVIADTVKAGFNALLNRDLNSDQDADKNSSASELASYFPNPQSAIQWITNVVGDQVITTCNDKNCKKDQSNSVGHGLLPWVTSCQIVDENCADTIRDHLTKLVGGNEAITKENLLKVSASGIVISPDVISAIRTMDSTQQMMVTSKLAQEVSVQRVIDKAFIAKNILEAGKEVPVIASNHPAQLVIQNALTNLDSDIRALAFESQMRKQMMSNTVSDILKFGKGEAQRAVSTSPVSTPAPLMENGAVPIKSENSK